MNNYYLYKPLYALLMAFVLLISCTGQTSKHTDASHTLDTTSISKGQPKLIKTQGSTESDNVHCSIEDKVGNLWFGTTGEGVYRYDGKLFTQFTKKDGLNSNCIYAMLEDKAGNIWFGTENGVCRYDGKTFSNMPFTALFNNDLTHTPSPLARLPKMKYGAYYKIKMASFGLAAVPTFIVMMAKHSVAF